MTTVLHIVKHYQRNIERGDADEKRMLRCIEKLYHLPVTVQLLQDTGVGRTVNALRKGEGEVATAARALVSKWKQMVAEEEELENNQQEEEETVSDNDQHSQSSHAEEDVSPPENPYKHVDPKLERDEGRNKHKEHRKSHKKRDHSYDKKRERKREEDRKDDDDRNRKRKHDREKQYENIKSHKYEKVNSSDEEIEEIKQEVHSDSDNGSEHNSDNDDDNASDNSDDQSDAPESGSEEESESDSPPVEKKSHKSSRDSKIPSSSIHEKYSHRESSSSKEKLNSHKSKSSDHKLDKNDTSPSKSSSKDSLKHSDTQKYKHQEVESRKSSSSTSNTKDHSSSSTHSSKSSNSHHKSSHSEKSSSTHRHSSDKDRKHIKEEHSQNKEKHSKDHNSKDKHSSEREKHSSSREKHSSKDRQSSNGKDKHNSDKKHSHREKHSESEKKYSEDKTKKYTEKLNLPSSENVKENNPRKETRKDDYPEKKRDHKGESKKDSSSKHQSSSKEHSSKSSSSKSEPKSKSKEISDEYVPESKKKKTYEVYDDGIDGGSGASFAEALGMISPSKSSLPLKKKVSTKPSSTAMELNSDYTSSKKSTNDVTPSLLQPSTKLSPLPPLTVSVSALPDISPNYVPRPPPKLIDIPYHSSITEEEAMKVVMNSKNQRTKVFSGNKVIHGSIPSLYDLCVFVLQENINAIEFTGGVPYDIIKPVVDKATPDQLFTLEHYNAYLIEDTDPLWKIHCNKKFRNKERQEMESWREMFMRCSDEQEAKLKSLTANIKLSQDKSLPVRQTKMAYIDSTVKPPRSVARKQAIYGTARKPVASPAARVASLANNTVFNASTAVGAGTSSSSAPKPSGGYIKPKKAPLMQKALQLMKGRNKR